MSLSFLLLLFFQNLFHPDNRVQPDNYTVLMATDAAMSPGLQTAHGAAHMKREVTSWTSLAQEFRWQISAPAAGDYAVNIVLEHIEGSPVKLQLAANTSTLSLLVPHNKDPERYRWSRHAFPGVIALKEGPQTITLRAAGAGPTGNFNLTVWSLELVQPAVRQRLHAAAMQQRVNPAEFQKLRYGFMVHWTPQSFPRHGDRKPYADAVRDFDVEGFSDQVKQGGAGFVVLVTAHALQYLPAPIHALDRILPGRTTKRDLIAELAAALQRRGIRLMLYYHLGAAEDPEWLKATGFWDTDTSRFLNNWESIVTEVGTRYGDRVAGWWFDDGMNNYYYRSPDWERLNKAAHAGNPSRMVSFNRWLWPPATEFQDYDACEVCTDSTGNGWLPQGGDGRYTAGLAAGLPAAATLITEGDWVHGRKNTEVGPPRWTAAQMRQYLRDFIARKNVPIFNLEIYQEGKVSPDSIEMFAKAKAGL